MNYFQKMTVSTSQYHQKTSLMAERGQKSFIISSQIIDPSFEISKDIFNVSLALQLRKLSLKMEIAGLLIHHQKRCKMSKTLDLLNSYCCKLSNTFFNFFVSSKLREIWEFKNLALEYKIYRNWQFKTGITAYICS